MIGAELQLAAAIDRVTFARLAGLDPQAWQTDVLRSPAPRMLLRCSRQSGKSTVTSVLALHAAAIDGHEVVILSPTQRQSGLMIRKVSTLLRSLALNDWSVAPSQESALSLTFANGGRITALPGSPDTIRGMTADLLIVDEAAFVDDATYSASRPFLATRPNARLLALSTPFGLRGWWSKAWHEEGDLWDRVTVRAMDCPLIAADFLDAERRSLPAHVFASEYMVEFVADVSGAFSHADVQRALQGDLTPLFEDGALWAS